ncbi:MAG: protein translocase subunit SecF, partial [Candidatus Zixiibacteriota bacterium]
MFRILKDTHINFIGHRGKAFILSALLVMLGLFAFVMVVLDKANMGIDFAGGTMLQGNFDNPINIADLRNAVVSGGFPEASIQELDRSEVGVYNSYMIRVKETAA